MAALVVSGGLYGLGFQDMAATVAEVCASFGLIVVGLGHKLEKGLRVVSEAAKFAADQAAKQNAGQIPPPAPPLS